MLFNQLSSLSVYAFLVDWGKDRKSYGDNEKKMGKELDKSVVYWFCLPIPRLPSPTSGLSLAYQRPTNRL